MKLVTEYLIIVDKGSSEAFYNLCERVSDFNRLLQKEPDIIVKDSKIVFKKDFSFLYDVRTNKIQNKDQRFFYTQITFDDDEKNINEYISLLETIRGIVHRNGGQPETLWDDVSLYYAQKAYPRIHNIEI